MLLVGDRPRILIISSADGRWARHVDHFADLFGTGDEYAVGLALARWELRPIPDPSPEYRLCIYGRDCIWA